jgi:transcriptional regulator with XRE-family HTH domain
MQFAAVSRELPGSVGRVNNARELAPAHEIDVCVGQRLRARRTALGISQGRLGQQLGLTFSQVQKYEKGTNRIGAGRLYHLAAILGVPVHYFFEGLDEPKLRTHQPVAAAGAAEIQDLFDRISDENARRALLSLASSMVDG